MTSNPFQRNEDTVLTWYVLPISSVLSGAVCGVFFVLCCLSVCWVAHLCWTLHLVSCAVCILAYSHTCILDRGGLPVFVETRPSLKSHLGAYFLPGSRICRAYQIVWLSRLEVKSVINFIYYLLITACCRTSSSAWNGGQVCQIAEDCRRRTSPEGRSCKLQGKAPITGPYTPKWRPNDQEERAHCWVGCRVTDKEDGSCH